MFYTRFFDPDASLIIHRGKLPHWRQEGVIYFVTFHLADSLPQTTLEWLRRGKELWLRLNPEPHTESQRRQGDAIDDSSSDTMSASLRRSIVGSMRVTAGVSSRSQNAKPSWNPVSRTLTGCATSWVNLWLCQTTCTRLSRRSVNMN